MENNLKSNSIDRAVISITAQEESTGFIQYLDQTINFSLAANEIFTHEIISSSRDILHRNSGVIEKKGVLVSSSGRISVHAFNLRNTSSDASVILPINALGKEYIVTAHFNDMSLSPDNFESTLLIVAAEDQTRVEIVPSKNTIDGKIAGTPFEIILDKQESYQLKARGDLTGSQVNVLGADEDNCKRIAVFGGNKMTQAGSCNGTSDHLFQQSYPVSFWGKSFVHIPFLDRTSGELVKVLASENGTVISVNGQTEQTLNAGQFITFDFDASIVRTIEGTNPISVTAISKSQDCDEASLGLGDPTMIAYNPNNHLIKKIVFNSLQSFGFVRHYVNIIVPTDAVSETFLNGKPIGNDFTSIPGNPNLKYASIPVSSGSNTLINPNGLIAYAYGYGFKNSYGFSAGASFEDSDFEVISSYDFEVEGDRIACLNQEGVWELFPENPAYTEFLWDFGDGSPIKNGKSVTHQYEKEGEFVVKIHALSGDAGCPLENDFEFEVTVQNSEFEIIGNLEVCPGSVETYELGNSSNVASLEWDEIIGGEILEATDQSIKIKWNDVGDDTGISVVGISTNGCKSSVKYLEVEIGAQSIDQFPDGPNEICVLNNKEYMYRLPEDLLGSDRQLEWVVEGGVISQGEFSETVFVIWDEEETERSIAFKFLQNSGNCGEISQKLEITFNPNVIFENALILGEEEVCLGAEVTYEFTSDTPFSSLDWTNIRGGVLIEAQGNSSVIRWTESVEKMGFDLVPYTEDGCLGESVSFLVSIKQSEEVEPPIGSAIVCGPGSNEFSYQLPSDSTPGEIVWEVDGGEIIGSATEVEVVVQWYQDESSKSISYFIMPAEATSCPQFSKPLEIQTLEQIEVIKIEDIKPSCPGNADGSIEIFVEGGSGNFEYQWKLFPDITSPKLDAIGAGEYEVTVFDADGCGFAVFTISLSDPPGMQLQEDLVIIPTSCYGAGDGGFKANISGGTPPFKILGMDVTSDGNSVIVRGLSEGDFSLFIEDSNGCILPVEGVISSPKELEVRFVEVSESCPGGNFGGLAIEVVGGEAPYQYFWEPDFSINALSATSPLSTNNNSISNMPSGEYAVIVTDRNGCRVRAVGRIPETAPQVRMPTGFNPQDGVYYPVSNCNLEYNLQIHSRWGNIVYSGNSGWDGQIEGIDAPIGTYSYQISYQYLMDDQWITENKSGVFTLIR
ncbi:PKD domain-containing protein [Algoriphagus namhaensis]|uniref:PKD domain-containing protein n=1 Tax=Algoriphagus namhaensis TaxID=915353 RepID=A0ABV8AW21_9BACT